MTTSGTKTRALCVATRCTSVDQFVATFHRFCGDDQSFFVATLTSRPIGLETPFSIQLADKQPVLRGLCIVLDAWATPENRFKRPGIRLGIKRLTADSQLVFDRLRAASKSVGVAEATPPPGPPPVAQPPASPLASRGSPPPQPSLAQLPATVRGSPAPAGPPPPVALRGSPAPAGSQPPVALRGLPPMPPAQAPPVAARSPAMPPPLPRVTTARREAPPEIPPPPLPQVPSVEPVLVLDASPRMAAASPPALDLRPLDARSTPTAEPRVAPSAEPRVAPIALDARPAAVASEPGSRPAAPAASATPIAVTRFQVALNVDGALPPIDEIEFRPRQLPYRPRVEPQIVSDPEPDAGAYEPGTPAMIVDRPSDPLRERHAVPSAIAGELRSRPQDVAVGEPLPAIDLRTPGSALVLPANPLQDLSDESIEGFVDCTLYEESGNFFHPAADDGEWNEDLAEPPAAPLATRSTGPGTVPAMPYDTAPDLTVLARGDTESLRVARDEPSGAPPQGQAMPPHAMPPQTSSPAQPSSDASLAPPWPDAASASGPAYPTYPTVDTSQYPPQYATPQASSQPQPVAFPDPETLRLAPTWPRWLIIGGTAVAAIVVAFILARMVRGSPRAEPARAAITGLPSSAATGAPASSRSAPDPSAPSRSVPDPSASSRSASGSSASGSSASTRSASGPAAGNSSTSTSSASTRPASGPSGSASSVSTPSTSGSAAPTRSAATASSAGAPGDLASPDDEDGGAAVPGGAPIVGHGPCRFNVATTPAGSIVRLDDQAMGPSPVTIDATCEKHRVDISHARYQTVTRWVTLAADRPQELDVNLPRPTHAVTVTSFPPGAELSIDGRRAGTTPTVVQMMGFATVNLTFSKAGFQSVTKKVYSKLAQDRVFVKLMK